MADLNFATLKACPWRQRNAAIEAAARAKLGQIARGETLTSFDFAGILDPNAEKEDRAKLAQILSRMAPFLGGLATHDGEKIIRFGRQWQRWNWHGQA